MAKENGWPLIKSDFSLVNEHRLVTIRESAINEQTRKKIMLAESLFRTNNSYKTKRE